MKTSRGFAIQLKTGGEMRYKGGDGKRRGKNSSLWALGQKETFLQWSQKNGEFCHCKKVLVCLFEVCERLNRTDTLSCCCNLTLPVSWPLNKDLQLFKSVKNLTWKRAIRATGLPNATRHQGNRDSSFQIDYDWLLPTVHLEREQQRKDVHLLNHQTS